MDARLALIDTDYAWEEFANSTLVKSKDPARRLLRICTLYTTDRSVLGLADSSTSLEMPVPIHRSEGMAAVEGGGRPSSTVGGPVSGMIHRPSLAENVRTASTTSVSSTGSGSGLGVGIGEEKPLASGNGVSLTIALAEPVLFLQGVDQSELGNQNTTMLRGSFHLRVSKAAKIKTISLAFRGRAETEWPEGAPAHSLISIEDWADILTKVFHPKRPNLGTRRA